MCRSVVDVVRLYLGQAPEAVAVVRNCPTGRGDAPLNTGANRLWRLMNLKGRSNKLFKSEGARGM